MMLTVENLDVSYGKTPILRDISLTVDDGEIVGIMGKNGVGKTTLIKAIMGLLEASSGRIVFKGERVADAAASETGTADSSEFRARLASVFNTSSKSNIWVSADERARRGMGYIPQGRDVFPDLTVEENLRMGEGINEDDSTIRYNDVYNYFPILEERRTQQAGTMSGGQQQMLAIGRALIGNPDLLLLDEPPKGPAVNRPGHYARPQTGQSRPRNDDSVRRAKSPRRPESRRTMLRNRQGNDHRRTGT